MRLRRLLLFIIIISFYTHINALIGPIYIYPDTKYSAAHLSTTIINDNDIANSAAGTFKALLSSISSIGFINAYGNTPAIFMRGTNSNHTLLLVDGIKMQDISAISNVIDFDTIMLSQIDNIKIMQGPFSVLYGSGAVGGVIQIFTKNNNSNISFSLGSNNTQQYVLNAISNNNNNNFVSFLAAKYHTDGISAKTNNDESDAIDKYSYSFKASYKINVDSNILFNLLTTNSESEYDSCYNANFSLSNNCLVSKQSNAITINIKHNISDTYKINFNYNSTDSLRSHYESNVRNFQAKYKTTALSLLNTINLNNSLLNIGINLNNDKNIFSKKSLNSDDIFLQWQQKISDIYTTVGYRVSNHSDFGIHNTYNVNLSKNLSNSLKLIANYGSAFSAPSIFQVNYKKTKNLQPEASNAIEIGLEQEYNSGLFVAKLFKNTIKNIIIYTGIFPDDYYENKDILNIYGIDLSFTTNINAYKLKLIYNYVNSKIDNTNKQSLRRPQNTLSLMINKKYNKFTYNLQIIGKSFSYDIKTDNTIIKLGAWVKADFAVNYNYNNNIRLKFNLTNMFNKKYTTISGYNNLGRNFNLTLNYKF